MEYKQIFDREKQEKMRSFFLNILAKEGVLKKYKKGEIIDLEAQNTAYVAIVTKGRIKQSIYSSEGLEKILYMLEPGEIFGEISYLGGGTDMIVGGAMEDSEISIVFEERLNEYLEENPETYRYLSHSMARKFRITMLQIADLTFNDAIGRIADILVRLYYQQGINTRAGQVVDIPLTHENIAKLLGSSRITVTKGMNMLKQEGIIDSNNKKIIIKDIDRLSEYIKWKR